jgi:predicted RNase H-like nuclease (RuvC/YqgF family)
MTVSDWQEVHNLCVEIARLKAGLAGLKGENAELRAQIDQLQSEKAITEFYSDRARSGVGRNPELLKKAITDQYTKQDSLTNNYVKIKRRDLLDLSIYVAHLEYKTKELENAPSR